MRAIIVLLAVALCCGVVHAQVPQKLNYQGYLTTPTGSPVNTAVVMTFRLYNDPVLGNAAAALYTETQLSVNVANGIFDAVIGSVVPLTLPFNQAYWLTVAINADPEMTPRQLVTASPYALNSASAEALAASATVAAGQITGAIDAATLGGQTSSYYAIAGGTIMGAQITGPITTATLPTGNLTGTIPASSLSGTIGSAQIAANAVTQVKLSTTGAATAGKVLGTDGSNDLVWQTVAPLPPCFDPSNRYKDCGDGTVYDRSTGLMWEQKLPSASAPCTDPVQANRNMHCEQNAYNWSAASPFVDPTGTLHSDFLERLNDLKTPNDGTATPCFAGYCDWRIPTIGELRSILLAPNPNCPSSPCIDPMFGPTQANLYWSTSSLVSDPSFAWYVDFNGGYVFSDTRNFYLFARAVRNGR